MQLTTTLVFFLILPLLGSLPAQTFVVDASNGPGTDFTQISTAVAAVPDGATLIVRPGAYTAFTIDGKGLTILADQARLVTPSNGTLWPLATPAYGVRNTAPDQAVTLQGLVFDVYDAILEVLDCRGPVLVEGLRVLPRSCNCLQSPPISVGVRSADQVVLRDLDCRTVVVWNSNCVIERSVVRGASSLCALGGCSGAGVGVSALGSQLQIADTLVQGGSGGQITFTISPNQPALSMSSSDVRVLGSSVLQSGTGPAAAVSPVTGTGTLRVDPSVTLAGAAPLLPAFAQMLSMPSITSVSAPPGGVLTATAPGPVGTGMVLVVGLPAPSSLLPGVLDPFWIDPTLHQFIAFGTAPLQANVNVPSQANFRGFRLAWHAVQLAQPLVVSNPSWSLVL